MGICKNCEFGQVPIGEHFVTHDMALDACEPQMEGMSMGIEYGTCQCCGGDWANCQKDGRSEKPRSVQDE